MKFHVGTWKYMLRITAGPLLVDGTEKLGAVCEAERELLISPACKPQSRLAVLLELLAHAHAIHAGTGHTAASTASVCASAMRDLAINGGERALMRLTPGESLEPGAARLHCLNTRQTPCCNMTLAPGSVIAEATGTIGVCRVSLFCECCGRVARWHETFGPDGQPSGARASEDVEFLRGEDAAEFLRRWPMAAPEYLPA